MTENIGDFLLLPYDSTSVKSKKSSKKFTKRKIVDEKPKKCWPKGRNREVVYELHQLQQILGEGRGPDEEELELQRRVFGGESDIVEELNALPLKKKKKLKKSNKELKNGEEIEDNISDCEESQKEERKPAWEDDDDDSILLKEKADTLKNCHRSVSLRGGEKYSDYVREKFVKLMGAPKWAELGKDDAMDNSEDDSDDELLQKTGNFIKPSTSLPKGIINIRKCTSLVDGNSKGTIIKSVEFHPTSKVALVAGMNSTVTLYQIDGKINSKIQSVHFEKFPIHKAHFTVDGNEIIAGSKNFGYFFTYDMIAGKVIRVPWEKGMEQMNIRRFHMSPDGKYIAIHGLYGHIHLITVKTKEWIASLKMNGEVCAITFNRDGSRMYTHGDTGEIYVWDMHSRRCIHKFTDEGCITGTSLALSPNEQYLAAGSDAGVVNIFDTSKILGSTNPVPTKTLLNLTTEVDQLKFNCTSELLVMASSHKSNALRLVHFPSATVFSNFPTKERSMQNINCMDISLNSGYLATGNNRGSVFLHRLRHYMNY